MSPALHREHAQLVGDLPQRLSRCIHHLVEDRVETQPNRPAILAHDGQYSYAELWTVAGRLATRLMGRGALPEARAAVLMDKSANYSIAILAVLKSGAAFVPLDPGHPVQRLKQLVQNTNPFVVITTASLAHLARRLSTEVLVVDDNEVGQSTQQPATIHKPTSDNAAYIMFTSGSTGKPKGVIIEHAAFATSAMSRGRVTGLGPHSRVLQFAAHTFDVAVDEILSTLIHGGCVCVPSETERFEIGPAIARMQVNHALLTPTSAALLDPHLVPSLTTIQMGGELLSEHINNKWSNCVQLFNVYGPTEVSVASVMNDRTGQQGAGHVIGDPVGTICFVVDVDDHDILASPDVVGELVIGGHTLARGYLNDKAKTDAAFVSSPSWVSWTEAEYPVRFYKTGDLASMDSDGSITIHGRKDNQIKLRGQRINVEEIEVALQTNGHVHGVIVHLPKDGPLRNKLTAVVPDESQIQHQSGEAKGLTSSWSSSAMMLDEDTISELHTSLRSTVPLTMIPSVWITLPQMPQNSSSKTDRKQIRSWLDGLDELTYQGLLKTDRREDTVSVSVQRTELEAKLEAIWSQVLNTSKNGLRPHQSFVRNGGDSITAMELRSLAKDIGLSFKISDILTAESIKDLLKRSSSEASHASMHVEEETGKPFPLSPTQRFYFESTTTGTESFTQQACFELRSPCREETIRFAITNLVSRHSMLRARFSRSNGDQLQYITENNDQSFTMSKIVLRPNQDLETLLSEHRPSLSPSQGPVFHALLIERSNQYPVLLFVAHHLVIDFVSWRVILQDLEDIIKGNKLLPVTMPYQRWCNMQSDFITTLDTAQLLNYPVNPSNESYWVSNQDVFENLYGNIEEVPFSIPVLESQALLIESGNIHGTTPAEMIMATLFRSFAQVFSDRETPTIFVESHGREPWDQSIDISRTVGWFTTAYPLSVPRKHAQELKSAISYTRRQRGNFPDNGHAYWCCRHLTATGQKMFANNRSMEFVFNFAGQYQRLDREDSILRRLSPVGEEKAHPAAARLSIFDILVATEGGQLNFNITIPKNIRHRDRIDRMTETWRRSLMAIATETLRASRDISQKLKHFLVSDDVDVYRDAEEVYRVSKLQQHILQSQVRNPLYYQVIGIWKLEARDPVGCVDSKRLRKSWEQVVKRHENLRTVFAYGKDSDDFVGIVLSTSNHAITNGARSRSRDSAQSLHLPHRLNLFESEDGSVLMRLEFSHAIIDATSRDILLRELFAEYDGQAIQSNRSDYTQYLDHLNACSKSNGPINYPRCIFPTTPNRYGEANETVLHVTVPQISSAHDPFGVCRSSGITFSSLVFTVWSLVLSRYTNRSNTSFAYTISDRSSNVPNVKNAVGCYIKLIVCSVDWSEDVKVWDMAQRVQNNFANCLSGDLQPVDACDHPENGRSGGLLNTMVNVRNTAAGPSPLASGSVAVNLEGFEDPWNYDIALSVNGSDSDDLDITIDYRNTSISKDVAKQVAGDVSVIFGQLLENKNITRYGLGYMTTS